MGKLKVGDRIRIVAIPGEGIPGYTLHKETKWVFKKLIERNRPVRISELRHQGAWFDCRFFRFGRWESHSIGLFKGEEHLWVRVNAKEAVAKKQT